MFEQDRRVKLLTLGATCFGLFMVMLDGTVVNLALPTIQRNLGSGFSGLQWIIDAFTLVIASFMLTGGTLGDLYGRKRAFMAGVGVFTAGSLFCALAPSLGVLIAARAVQGLGAAVMLPSSLSIINNTFRDARERAQAIGIWAGISGTAMALGPVVGGVMVDSLGWQSIFYLNVPIGIIALVLTARVVRESKNPEGRGLDIPGQLLAIVGLGSLTFAFIESSTYGWGSVPIISLFAVAGLTLTAFTVVELRTLSPMLDLTFFRNRTFFGANIVGLLVSFGFFGILFFLALFMQNVLGYTAAQAGVRQLPTTLATMVSAILAGRIVGRIGARAPITIGMVLLGAAVLLFATVKATSTFSSFWWMLIIMGIGNGLVMSPTTTAIMSIVPPARAGMAAATLNTTRQVGSVFGIAVLGSIVTGRFTSELTKAVRALNLSPLVSQKVIAIAHQGQESVSLPSGNGIDTHAIARAIGESFTSGLHLGLWICGALVLSGAAVSFFTVHGTSPQAQIIRRTDVAGGVQTASVEAAEHVPASSTTAPRPETVPAAISE